MARRSPYGYAMQYTPKPKPKKKTTASSSPYGPPQPPDARFIAQVFPEWKERSDEEWDKLLDERTQPFEDAANKSRAANLSQSEFQFERASEAQTKLGAAFASLLMGGKTGDEGTQFAKDNFGGQYMPLQALSMAQQKISELTNDWNDRDWEIATQYQKAIAEIPGVREQLRADIEKGDQDEYTRNFNLANLYLDEAWNMYNAQAKQYNTDQQLRLAAIEAAKVRNQQGYTNRKDAVSEAAKFADDNGNIWSVRQNKDGSFSAYDTGKKKPVKPGSKPKPAAKASGPTMEFNPDGSPNPNYKPPVPKTKPDPKTGLTAKEKTAAEQAIALKVQVDWHDEITGKADTNSPTGKTGGKDYASAVTWLTRIARDQFPWRNQAWIDGWVRRQLAPYFPQGTTDARGGP